jgi:Flp pilus assembly protein CpaB
MAVVGVAVRTEGNGAATTTGNSSASRLLTRRRNLPSGRAVVGGFLVALAALGAFVAARGTGDGPSQHFVVVAHDVIAGTTLRASDLRTEAVDLPGEMAGRAFTDPAAVIGRITTTALANGELVQASSVVGGDAADPRFQLSVPVERSRALDGFLVAGEKVDVLATYGTGTDAVTFVVVRGADVLRIDQGQRGTLTATNDTIILLAVARPDDALAVTHAAQAGKITIVRATAAQADNGPDSYRQPTAKPG